MRFTAGLTNQGRRNRYEIPPNAPMRRGDGDTFVVAVARGELQLTLDELEQLAGRVRAALALYSEAAEMRNRPDYATLREPYEALRASLARVLSGNPTDATPHERTSEDAPGRCNCAANKLAGYRHASTCPHKAVFG